jgi:putative transposase
MPEGQSSRTHTAPGEGESVWLVEDLIEVKLSAEDTGGAWQRCRTHYAADLMSTTPKSSWAWVRHCCTPSTTRPTPHRFTPCSTASPTPSQRSCPAWRGTSRTPVRPSSPSPRSPGDLATDLVDQPQRTAQQGDPPPHRRGRHLPRSERDHRPRRRRPGRAARRMGRRPPLPRARRPRPSPGPRHHDRGGDRRTDPASHRGLTQPQRRITPDTPRQRT